MKKFILIDHSIAGIGGHYFEYAKNVLESAKKQNYQPHLFTNKKFTKSIGIKEGFTVQANYSLDIWGEVPKKKKKSHHWEHEYKKIKDIWSAKIFYSKYGLLYNARHSPKLFLSTLKSILGFLFYLTLPIIIISFIVYMFLKPITFITQKIITYVNKAGEWYLSPLFSLLKLRFMIKSYANDEWVAHSFYQSTEKSLSKIKFNTDDIIFIPTLSENDLAGLIKFWEKNPNSLQASWHLVFRRNIFKGQEHSYSKQLADLGKLRNLLAKAISINNENRILFYTDTERLTDQYNKLNVTPFLTLPIPISEQFYQFSKSPNSITQKIIYAGDARQEKGYQFIPYLVEKLQQKSLPNPVYWSLQSNFSFDETNPLRADALIIVARQKLEQFHHSEVHLHKKPMKSDEYVEFVKQGDIGLLLYDRNNYYARSSGALVECLSVGMPVIVPAASWLSEQIIEHTNYYLKSLIQSFDYVQKWETNSILNLINKFSLDKAIKAEINPPDESHHIRTPSEWTISLNQPSSLFGFEYKLSEYIKPGSFVKTIVKQYNDVGYKVKEASYITGKDTARIEANYFLVPIHPETQSLSIKITNCFHESSLHLDQITIYSYQCDKPASIPLGTIGLIYSDIAEVPDLITNMVTNRSHFRQTALDFSRNWNKYHHVDNLVSILSLTQQKSDLKSYTTRKINLPPEGLNP